jgi:hypothetical protein
MRDEADRLLYVGKAKNLRRRLNSYRYPARAPRKTVRLVHAVPRIDWEVCPSEKAACLRENELLRAHRPRFNRVGTWPKACHFIAVRSGPDGFALELQRGAASDEADGALSLFAHLMRKTGRRVSVDRTVQLYGAFKAGGGQAFGALLQMLWLALNAPASPDACPRRLLLNRAPRQFEYRHHAAGEWATLVSAFLAGTSEELFARITSQLSAPDSGFHRTMQEAGMELLHHFFLRGPKRNRDAQLGLGRAVGVVRQDELDDLLVLANPASLRRPRLAHLDSPRPKL